MKNTLYFLIAACAAHLFSSGLCRATTYTTTTFTDFPITPGPGGINVGTGQIVGGAGNGQVSIRSAIIASNYAGGANIINLQTGTYTLTQGPYDDEFNAGGGVMETGDLDIFDLEIGGYPKLTSVTINGIARDTTIVQMGTLVPAGQGGIGKDRVLEVNDGVIPQHAVNVILTNLTVTGGLAARTFTDAGNPLAGYNTHGGGIQFDGFESDTGKNSGKLTLTNCKITGNRSAAQGGGVFALFCSVLIQSNSIISSNTCDLAVGGGISYAGGNTIDSPTPQGVTITDSTITGNNAPDATFGSGAGLFTAGGGFLTITNTTISANNAGITTGSNGGGGIYIGNTPSVTITNSTISGNFSKHNGGGIWVSARNVITNAASTMTLSGVSVTGNTADSDNSGAGNGGGIYNFFGSTIIQNTCHIDGNSAVNGGGIFNFWSGIAADPSASLTVTGGTIGQAGSGNNAKTSGGGVAVAPGAATTFGTISLNNATIVGNSATTNGGGLFISSGTMNVTGGYLVTNTTSGSGGGMTASGGTLTAKNLTISGNLSNAAGGGMSNSGTGTQTLTNVTISNNRSDANNSGGETGGGIARTAGTVTLQNTLAGGNFRGTGSTADDVSGAVTANNSLVENTTGATLTGTNNVTGQSPRLGPLQNNGGSTLTHQLLGGSPALDAGSNTFASGLTTDQRGTGFARVKDAGDVDTTDEVDIGAYEAHPAVEDVVDQVTNEDTAKSVTVNFGDTDLPITSFTATSSNTTLVPNANIAISGSGSSRALNITPVANLFGNATITVTVNGTENAVAFSSADTFLLTVNPVADTPSATGATTLEDTQTASGLVLSRNAVDGAEVSHFKITGITGGALFKNNGVTAINNNDLITFAEGNAGLRFTPAANANTSAGDLFGFTVQGAVDAIGTGISPSVPVAITVTAVNDAPTLNTISDPPAILEDAGLQTVNLAGISAGPTNESAQTLTVSAISNNTALIPNPTVNYTSPNATGSLTYTPVANANGGAIITVTVTDNGGTANGGVNTFQRTFTVNVTAANDVPSFTKGADQTVNEDAAAQTVAGWATALSAGPADEAGQVLNFIVGNNNPALFSAQPAIAANGTLTYTPAANANGSATVTVQIHDNGGVLNGGVDTSVAQSFLINVTAVNDVPGFTKGADVTVNEDAGAQAVGGWATAISAGPANESVQVLNFIVNNNNNALFSVQPAIAANGMLTYTPVANANGSAVVSVQIHDNGGVLNGGVDTSAVQSFLITVNAVNDVPSFIKGADQTVNEDALAQTVPGWATALSVGPANEAGQVLNFIVGNNNPALFLLQPAIAANGTLTYTPAPNANGVANVTVQIHDNGGVLNGGVDTSAPQSFTITITAFNDPPVITAQATPIALAQGHSRTIVFTDLTVTDPDNTYPTGFTLTVQNGANYSRVGNMITPTPGFVGTLTVPVQVNDGTANSGVFNLVVTVNPNAEQVATNATIAPEPGGGFRVSFLGAPGASNTIQYTNSLATVPIVWQPLGTAAAGANGRYSVVDIPPANTPMRYYRSIEPCLDDFNNGLGAASLRGTAVLTNSAMKLTDEVAGGSGAVVFEGLLAGPALTGFTARFNLALGPGTAPPADGASFAVGNLGATVWGEMGPATPNSLAVGFDTFPNGPANESIGIHIWVNGAHLAVNATNPYTNGATVPVEISYDTATGLTVRYNSVLIFTNLAIPGFTFPAAGGGFGIGARTGGSLERAVVDDVEITPR